MRKANYDKFPVCNIPGADNACCEGWDAIAETIQRTIANKVKAVVVVECYTGVLADTLLQELRKRLNPQVTIDPASPVSYTHLTLPTNREV